MSLSIAAHLTQSVRPSPPKKKNTGSEAALFLSERAAAFLDDCEIYEVETAFISGVGGGGRELRTRGCALSARASVWADDDRPSVWQPPIEASLTHALLLQYLSRLICFRFDHRIPPPPKHKMTRNKIKCKEHTMTSRVRRG